MLENTWQILNQATKDLYTRQASSFSRTRAEAWEGWNELFERHLKLYFQDISSPQVLDVAAGNGRFEVFLLQKLQRFCSFFTVDTVPLIQNQPAPQLYELMGAIHSHLTSLNCDIVQELQSQELATTFQNALGATFDLTVAFGFMHHIPSFELRVNFLNTLAQATSPGGLIVISCWQFMNEERLAAKARRTTPLACQDLKISLTSLENNDYFLGWQDSHEWRYCHYISPQEQQQICRKLEPIARCIDIFCTDGISHTLNTYLVFERL